MADFLYGKRGASGAAAADAPVAVAAPTVAPSDAEASGAGSANAADSEEDEVNRKALASVEAKVTIETRLNKLSAKLQRAKLKCDAVLAKKLEFKILGVRKELETHLGEHRVVMRTKREMDAALKAKVILLINFFFLER